MGRAAADANHTRAQTLARPLELHAAPDRHRQFATTILAKLEDQKCGSLQASDSCFHHSSQRSFRDESNSPRLLPLAALLESNVQFRKGLATAPAPVALLLCQCKGRLIVLVVRLALLRPCATLAIHGRRRADEESASCDAATARSCQSLRRSHFGP